MKSLFVLTGFWLLSPVVLASPQVAAYERFHAGGPSAAGGALLYSELGCANCHGGSEVAVPRQGPSLENLSSRVEYDWVEQFLKEPESGRHGSTMPRMLHGRSDEDVKAVLAYLSTFGKGLRLKPARHANAEQGSALYHEKGCVACHAPTPDFQGPAGKGADLVSRFAVPLPDLKTKTSLVALEHFLLNTSRYRPDGRMPHVELGRDGAINVAAHLLDLQGSDPRGEKGVAPWPKANAEQITRGKALIKGASCAACHDLPGITAPEPVRFDPGKMKTEGHCLSADPREGLPHFALTDGQRKSLLAYLAGPPPEMKKKAEFTLQAMNCLACHKRDEFGGPLPETDPFFVGDESLGDSGRLPPPLTGIGHKLNKDWLVGVLTGDADKRVRPYLKTAMPSYSNQARVLSDLLITADGKPNAKPLADASAEAEAGRRLVGTQGGVGCIACHHWGKNQSVGIPGLDISSLNERLRPEWFRSYMMNPASYRPGTLMPALWPEGRSSIPTVLDGDTEMQIAAIWEYISNGDGTPEGFPDRSGGRFELQPTKRPIVQRTFMTGAGTKAILVGFPGEIHLAYDGAEARPALIWRGAFFDAYHTWFTRAAPFEKPLGDQIQAFPKVKGTRRFRGYELDESGNPIFLFSESGRLVKERFEVREGTLERSLSWEQGDVPVVSHPEGVAVEEQQNANRLKAIYRWK